MRYNPKIVTTTLALLFCFAGYCQSEKMAMKWFDDQIGFENTSISSGPRFYKEFRTKKEHHSFLIDGNYHPTTIKFNNQVFYNVDSKFDLYKGNLIVKTNSGAIILEKKDINYFNINNQYLLKNIDGTFYESKYTHNDIELIKKSIKKPIKFYGKDYPFYIYHKFDEVIEYYIVFNNEIKSVKSKREWINLFPENKKVIKRFFSNNKNLFKNSKELFFINLINKLER